MIIPKTEEEMKAIINEWADCQNCGDGDEMVYFACEVLEIIKFMDDK